ncbi:helix-turn-helix transcriptional regulator [Mucilaginibacter sp. ZT4R22]|uniref:Helix-turn-helix transcriptional regulator n=1 Tax=Mucilaginibacter pankratovii TaxID=2772110 RepID=A0ABR7WSC5_9SPHI|nr:helix-turn-helix transcriptional regulator [Mucilaginibacter pankratovii]MBD1365151.1 helix-turn-helix transcriptional regulator [Mucilaginibacter pankratovii]
MKTGNGLTFLGRLLDKVCAADLLHSEHRLALGARIEHLLAETGLNRMQFGNHIRVEMNELRGWLSGTRDLTLETLTEICALFHISIGDLVTEQA